MVKELSFISEDCKMAANLYLPDDGDKKYPLVILCYGFAGVKELLLPRFADYYVSRGLATSSGNQPMIPLVKMLTDPQSLAFVAKYQEDFPEALQIRIPFITIKDTMTHKPIMYLKSLRAALHLTMAQNDEVNPPLGMQKLFDQANEPKDLYVAEGAGHYDVYEAPYFSEVAKRQRDWFLKYL